MKAFEKLLFLEVTNKQFNRLPSADYFDAWAKLNENEKENFGRLSRELHQIWTHLNTPILPGLFEERASNYEEYHEKYQPVSAEILEILRDYDLDLKNDMTAEFKRAFIQIFGKKSFDELFGTRV